MAPVAQAMTQAEVDEVGRCERLRPQMSHFEGRKGYSRKYRFNADGTPMLNSRGEHKYEAVYKYKSNEKGKLTKEAHEVIEMMAPFTQADTQRFARRTSNQPRARLLNHRGEVVTVPADKADSTARSNGWRHHASYGGGVSVERGADGMLFRWIAGGWEASGNIGNLTEFKAANRQRVYRDPAGDFWAWLDRAWRKLE